MTCLVPQAWTGIFEVFVFEKQFVVVDSKISSQILFFTHEPLNASKRPSGLAASSAWVLSHSAMLH